MNGMFHQELNTMGAKPVKPLPRVANNEKPWTNEFQRGDYSIPQRSHGNVIEYVSCKFIKLKCRDISLPNTFFNIWIAFIFRIWRLASFVVCLDASFWIPCTRGLFFTVDSSESVNTLIPQRKLKRWAHNALPPNHARLDSPSLYHFSPSYVLLPVAHPSRGYVHPSYSNSSRYVCVVDRRISRRVSHQEHEWSNSSKKPLAEKQ